MTRWLKPRAPKPIIPAELLGLGRLSTLSPTHTHLSSGECGLHSSDICGKVRTGTNVGSSPRRSLNAEPLAAPPRRSLLEEGGGRREGRQRKRQRKGCGRAAVSPRGRRVSSALSRSQQSELVGRLGRATPTALEKKSLLLPCLKPLLPLSGARH